MNKSTVSAQELAKFSRIASEWWNPTGKFRILHQMNPQRVKYIAKYSPLKHQNILDIGCGGGLLSESLARLGANVLGADAAKENIAIAEIHQQKDHLVIPPKGKLQYVCTTAENIVQTTQQFDTVCALEIIEHVSDRQLFLESCVSLVKPGGHLFISTINKTLASYLFTIVLAENVLGWVPKGTHDHGKYVDPTELRMDVEKLDCEVLDISGMHYNPLTGKWSLAAGDCITDLEMNYIMAIRKNISYPKEGENVIEEEELKI